MEPIICANNLMTVLGRLQDYLAEGRIIRGLRLVDSNDQDVVILVDERFIDEEKASIWWSGYKAALQ